MQPNLETPFAPILAPADAASFPAGPFVAGTVYVPMRPDRRGRAVGRSWLRRLGPTRRVWGHTCVSDHTLRRLDSLDPFALKLAADLGAHGVLTPDVPLYGFMNNAQRERAADRHLHRLLRVADAGPRRGLAVIPLLKALDVDALDSQLDLVQGLGFRRAAVYAREFLLEHDTSLLRRFVRGSHKRRIAPLLLGAQSPRALAWGPAELAAQHPYVLARRGFALDPRGRRRRTTDGAYSRQARRFLVNDDVRSLCTHNFLVARDRLMARPQPLEA